MQLLLPDILLDAVALSLPVLGTALVLGVAWWALGWRTHRFWVVLVMTVLAGIYGLYEAPGLQAHPVLAALLLAVSAGVLALALIRVLAFAAGGATGVLLMHAVAPTANYTLAAFLAAGLIGLFLFRFWIMALTSFSGTLVMSYAGLALLNQLAGIDVVGFADTGGTIFNWACGLVTVCGVVVQYLIDRRRGSRKEKKSGKSSASDAGEFLLALPILGWPKGRKAG